MSGKEEREREKERKKGRGGMKSRPTIKNFNFIFPVIRRIYETYFNKTIHASLWYLVIKNAIKKVTILASSYQKDT